MNLGALVSETRNPATMGLDEMSTLEMIRCFNQEDRKVPEAVEKVLPEIAQAVDLAVVALKAGARLIHLGLAPAGVLGCWMRPNVRRPSACRMAGWWV